MQTIASKASPKAADRRFFCALDAGGLKPQCPFCAAWLQGIMAIKAAVKGRGVQGCKQAGTFILQEIALKKESMLTLKAGFFTCLQGGRNKRRQREDKSNLHYTGSSKAKRKTHV